MFNWVLLMIKSFRVFLLLNLMAKGFCGFPFFYLFDDLFYFGDAYSV